MYISKLMMDSFGKFHNKEIEFRPGVNLVYGPNEAGKTTTKEFMLGMLYGIDKSRGLAARLDNYELRKPLNNSGYAGACTIIKGEKEYFVERNFDRSEKKLTVYDNATGRPITTKDNSLTGILFDMDKSRYLDTLCIGQQGADTSKELAMAINNYMINMSSSQTTDVDYNKVMEYLRQEKKKHNTKSLDEQLDKLSEDMNNTKDYDAALANINYRIEKLDAEYSKKVEEFEQAEDENIDEIEYETDKEILTNIATTIFLVLMIIAIVLAVVFFVPLNYKIRNGIIAFGVIIISYILLRSGEMRNRLRERQIEKSLELREEVEEEEDDTETVSFDKEYLNRLTSLRAEENKILEERAKVEDNTNLYNEVFSRREKYLIEIKAIEDAMNTIKNLSENIYDDFGRELNSSVSSIVNYMTDGKYTEVKLDEKMHITVRKQDSLIGIEYLSKGTIEQIYLAVRLAAAKLLGTESMPIIIDDIFGAYDEIRLQRTLEYLENFDTQQIIIFSADVHIGEMFDKLRKDYNYITI